MKTLEEVIKNKAFILSLLKEIDLYPYPCVFYL